ncbi:MAG: DUF3237 family protein [Janthinobacterium lividum]
MTTQTPHPFAPQFEFAFSIGITLSKPYRVEPTNMGATRWAIYAAEGWVEGPDIKGRVVPMSGGDFPLKRPDGVIDFDARYLLETDDGAIIYLQNRGYRWAHSEEIADRMSRNEPADHSEYYMRVVPKFEAPEGKYEWMSKHVFVGVAEKSPGANCIHYFKVL